MKKALLIALVLCIFASLGLSSAVEVIRFGPKQYTRSAGKPETITDSFSAVPGAGKVIIENGAGDRGPWQPCAQCRGLSQRC